MFVSDGLKSLEIAVNKVFKVSVHQKCIVHLQRNLLAYCRSEHKKEVADDFKKVLNPDDDKYIKQMALNRLNSFAEKWGKYYQFWSEQFALNTADS